MVVHNLHKTQNWPVDVEDITFRLLLLILIAMSDSDSSDSFWSSIPVASRASYSIPMASSDRIVWMDLEMYSLKDHRVLECAVILTTCNALTEVARKNWVIGTSQHDIDTRVLGGEGGTFHTNNSFQNGLIDACLVSATTYNEWQTELLAFLKTHCHSRCRLAGFSPHCDREVLRTQAPLVYEFLSHQIIDISSLDIIQWGLPALEADARQVRVAGNHDSNHRAMSDTEAAIRMLKWYQGWLREKTNNGQGW